jgi:putative phosphoesterase
VHVKIAVISDIHGNVVALEAVLESIARSGADLIVCLGDVATLGPSPAAAVEAVQRAGCAVVMGNHDAALLDPDAIRAHTTAPVIHASVDWCRRQLAEAEFEAIRRFEPRLVVPVGRGRSILFVHGSPRSMTEDVLSTTPPEALDEMLAGVDAMTVACGHTHLPMVRRHRSTLIVNAGSVGLPFEAYVGSSGGAPTVLAHAEYATIDVLAASDGAAAVTLHRVELDRGALRAAALESDLPLRGALVAAYS